jgi:hypothetical protein
MGESTQPRKVVVEEFVQENEDLLLRVLAHGHPEAQGRVLTLYAQTGSVEPIDRAIRALEQLREEGDPSR